MTDTLKPEPVKVTQADTQAALEFEDCIFCAFEFLEQAFARHRLNSSNDPRLIAALRQFVNGVETGMITSPADETLANIARNARNLLKDSSHGK